eukprot:989131-Rhodomonas_salina.1
MLTYCTIVPRPTWLRTGYGLVGTDVGHILYQDAASTKRNTLVVKQEQVDLLWCYGAYQVQVPKQAMPLEESMRDVEAIVSPLLKKNVSLINEIKNIPHLRGDSGRVTQILMNLVQNAVKFTSKGHITVRSAPLRPTHILRNARY